MLKEVQRSTHLESSLLDRDLAEDSSSIIRTHGLQLVLVEGEELSSGQHTQTVYSPVHTHNKHTHISLQSPLMVMNVMHVQGRTKAMVTIYYFYYHYIKILGRY